MSDKPDGRNPFEQGEGGTRSVIKGLVATATDTHRQTERESTRKRKRYPTEDRRSKITVDLDPATVATLREIVKSQKMGISKVTQALLDYALEAYESGQLTFELRPAVVQYRLEVVNANGKED